ncbi:MAG: metal ABC transporter substrate-binding protein [Clostridiales bacterium]|nr:metal ABC transporter substrate-binding protein [Clostridiales bacterium]
MKKTFALIMAGLMLILALSSCNNIQNNDKKKIVVTIFPEYDWVMNVLGDLKENYEVTLLMKNGTDLHNYQPTADDMVKISNCDLFIYVGGESDFWVENALINPMNKDRKTINLMEILGSNVLEEDLEEDKEETEYDEHVWLSLLNTKLFVKEISSALLKIDENNSKTYSDNSQKYADELDNLHNQFTSAVSEASKNVLVFGDRFPFRYFCKDYGITYFAAFEGCSADVEASFETVISLAEKLDEYDLNCIVKIESSDDSLPGTIINSSKNKDRTILTLDSMQSVSEKDIKSGMTYLSIMKSNLEVLKTALGN